MLKKVIEKSTCQRQETSHSYQHTNLEMLKQRHTSLADMSGATCETAYINRILAQTYAEYGSVLSSQDSSISMCMCVKSRRDALVRLMKEATVPIALALNSATLFL